MKIRTATLAVAGALSLAACAHKDSTPDSKVPLGATEMQGTAAPTTRQGTDVTSKTAPPGPPEPVATRVNARNPADAGAAPTDQGTGAADIGITLAIRKALMADKKLSAAARTVTILTNDSRVVLKGRVNTAEERTSVEAKARATSGVTDVYDQLDVRR